MAEKAKTNTRLSSFFDDGENQPGTDVYIRSVSRDGKVSVDKQKLYSHGKSKRNQRLFEEKIVEVSKEDIENRLVLDVENSIVDSGDKKPELPEREKEVSKLNLEGFKGQLKDILHDVARLPPSSRKEIIDEIQPALEQAITGAPPLPLPDPSGHTYPLYVRRTDPLAHLENVWGDWLLRCNPNIEKDLITQNDIKNLDPSLYNAIRNHLRTKEKIPFAEIVPPSK